MNGTGNFVEESKSTWSRTSGATTQDLILGCLQRIASACELMSKSYANIISDRDYYKRRYEEELHCSKRLYRSNAALRGHIKHMKGTGHGATKNKSKRRPKRRV